MNDSTPERAERFVGIFVIVAVLLLLAGFGFYLYRTAERRGWLVPRAPYHTYVASGEGLNVGDHVALMGFDVGEITVITAQQPGSWYKVYVGFEVQRPYYGYIWSDSKVKIAPSGFLGARRLEVTPGSAGEPTVYEKNDRISELLMSGRRVPFAEARKGVFIEPEEAPSVTDRAEKLLTQAEAALPNILAITNRLNLVLDHSAALTSNATEMVNETRPALNNVAVRLDAALLAADTNLVAVAGSLNDTLLNLASITGNLNTQVQSNDQILASISKLVVETDNLVQGLKKHWLLSGIFKKMNATNAPPAEVDK